MMNIEAESRAAFHDTLSSDVPSLLRALKTSQGHLVASHSAASARAMSLEAVVGSIEEDVELITGKFNWSDYVEPTSLPYEEVGYEQAYAEAGWLPHPAIFFPFHMLTMHVAARTFPCAAIVYPVLMVLAIVCAERP